MAQRGAVRAREGFRAWAACAIALALGWGLPSAAGAEVPKTTHPAELTAAEIAAKNIAARGGIDAWRNVQTMVWVGHLESRRTDKPSMSFVLDQKRPNKTRFEVRMMNERTMRVFDGTDGWKLHPGQEGRPNVEPYSPDEVRFARSEQAVDGPLMDLKARGSTVALAGTEQIDGRKAYRLEVRLNSGERQFVWVDAKTFLDVKVARSAFSATGQPRLVPTFYRNFQTFEGLLIPTLIEIGDPASGPTDRMEIERVTLNAPMNDRLFARPGSVSNANSTAPAAAAPAIGARPIPQPIASEAQSGSVTR